MTIKWEKKNRLGVSDNIAQPLMTALKETLLTEKEALERKLKNLKMLGVIAVDKKLPVEELNKKLEELMNDNSIVDDN